MDSFIKNIQNDLSNAFFFLFPLAGSILYFGLRTKIENSLTKNLLYSFLSMIGLMAFIISIYGALYSLSYALGLFPGTTTSQIGLVGLILLFFSIVYANLERQYFLFKLSERPDRSIKQDLEQVTLEQPHFQIITSLTEITTAARSEVLMFCGTMSFIQRDYEHFSRLKAGNCRVRALCKKPSSVEVNQRYKLARSLGIEIKYYPNDSLDPGIRGRIIDPNDFHNVTAILISKRLDTTNSIKYKYFSTFLLGDKHSLEMTLLNSLFRVLWFFSDVK